MTAQRTHGRLLSGMSGNGRRAKRRRAQFPEPVWTGSRHPRVMPASTPAASDPAAVELIESALRDTPPFNLTGVDDLLGTVSS